MIIIINKCRVRKIETFLLNLKVKNDMKEKVGTKKLVLIIDFLWKECLNENRDPTQV